MKILLNNIPSGVMLPYAGGTVPSGWLLCDGSTFSRSLYPSLFNSIGTSWGNGDGTLTAHLPDSRGRFLRGVDSGTGRDIDAATRTPSNSGGNSGDNVGSVQADTAKEHNHKWYENNAVSVNDQSYNSSAILTDVSVLTKNAGLSRIASGTGTYAPPADSWTSIKLDLSGETRPTNISVKYIIKI